MKPLKKLNVGFNKSAKSQTTSNSNNRDTTSPSTHVTIKTSRQYKRRIVQSFCLVWLDSNIDEVNNNDSVKTITQLRKVVNSVQKFTDVDACIKFMRDLENEKIFLICSGKLGQTTVPIVHNMTQIDRVYIFCKHRARHEQWTKEWSKVKGVYTSITSICTALKQAAQDCDHNSVSISFVKSNDGTSNENLDTLNQSFMYTQILKEILLTIDFDQTHIKEFLTYCREQFVGNTTELENIDKLEKEYRHHQPVWWYTYPCFLYSTLNRALRLMEVDLIIKMGFFVRDLHNHIVALHAKQYGGQNHSNTFTVYRGQGLSQTDFDQLKKTQGGLMSFNSFLSTSLDQAVSLTFVPTIQYDPDLIGVVFEITIKPSISTCQFANVGKASYYKGVEEEVLFSMHSVFRIGQVKQIHENNRLWQVNLALTADNDPQLHVLTERIREETFSSYKGWYRLGYFMIKLGHFNKAKELYEILLEQTSSEGEDAEIYHMLGMVKDGQGEYTEAAGFYEKSIEINQKILSPTHSDLTASYNNIGSVYNNMSEYSKALSYYETALEIKRKTLPVYHPSLATSYNNIGNVYNNMNEYTEALSYYEKGLEISQKTLPANHPCLATSYNNIGSVYYNMGEYSRALSYYKKDLEISQKTLPADHPDLATSYNNIGLVYSKVGDYSKSLSYYECALDVWQRSLSSNHPDLQDVRKNIEFVKNNL